MTNQKNDHINGISTPHKGLARTPLVFLVDISGSMESVKTTLNDSIAQLLQQMKSNTLLRDSVDLLVIHFNGKTNVVVDFKPLKEVEASDIQIQKCYGCTYTGDAISVALKKAREFREELYKNTNRVCKPNYPLVFLLTDGIPDAGEGASQEDIDNVESNYQKAAKEIKDSEEKKLTFVAAGIKQPNYTKGNVEKKLKELTNHPERVITIEGEGAKTNFNYFCKFILEGTTYFVKKKGQGLGRIGS